MNRLRNEINDINHKIHNLKRNLKKHWWRADLGVEIAGLGIKSGGVEFAYRTSKAVLSAAEQSVKLMPVELDPRVIAAGAALISEQAALKTAQGSLAAVHQLNKGLASVFKKLASGVTKFRIKRMSIAGSIKGIITLGRSGVAPKLILEVVIDGHNYTYKLDTKAVQQFSKLSNKLVDKIVKDIVCKEAAKAHLVKYLNTVSNFHCKN